MHPTNVTIAGVDVGYGYTKAVSQHSQTTILSMIGPAMDGIYHSDLARNGPGIRLDIDQQRLFVGDLARLQSPTPRSPLARRRDLAFVRYMALAALSEVGIVEGDVYLVTGLPVAWYTDRDQLERELLGESAFAVSAAPRKLNVIGVKVVPQPFGTFYREMIDNQGIFVGSRLAEGNVAVLDIGTGTTDLAWSEALAYRGPLSGGEDVGVSDVLRGVQRALAAPPYELEHSLDQIERDVRAGYITITGNRVRIDRIIDEAIAPVAARIISVAQGLWGEARDTAAFYVTGGGGAMMFKEIQHVYPHARLVTDPQMANVEGFYRLGLLKARLQGLKA